MKSRIKFFSHHGAIIKLLSLCRSQFSFKWKVGLAICIISVSITSIGFYYYYTASYQMTLGVLKKNLRDVGNVGTMNFDQESREAIQRLKKRALDVAVLDKRTIEAIPVGGTSKTISPDKIKEIHSSSDFKMILERLQMISYASFHETVPWLKESYAVGPDGYMGGGIATYLFIDMIDTLPEDFGMYLVSSCPDPVADVWPGNPIGNVFRTFVSLSKIKGKTWVSDDLITDDFYQSLSATIPIFDQNNKTIAFLGLDYSVGTELAKLNRLKQICYFLIIVSLLFSLIISYLISKSLNAPLEKLYHAAKKVIDNDYSVTVDIKTKDEFGLLGHVFNAMLANIQSSVSKLDMMNKNLENIVSDRTQELQKINEELNVKNHELEIPSTTDTLTGIFNRRYIEKQIQVAINRTERYGHDISLVMLDIDHFKFINDTYGHDMGDKVLISVAKTIVENIREVDIVGRWGGEEFIIILQTDVLGTIAFTEKVRQKIMEKHHGVSDKVTASFGYTQYVKGETIDSMIRRADQGLYRAKNRGRNRIETVTIST